MTIKVYRSSDFGAPSINGGSSTANTLTVLDKCLVAGYGQQVVTITRTGSVATVTFPSAHGMLHKARFTISGANEVDYNGEFVLTDVTTTTATFDVANAPVSPATGTIQAQVTPAGWTKPFSGTGKAVFQQASAPSMYVRIQDDGIFGGQGRRYAYARAYQNMTDVDTGTDPFPTSAQLTNGVLQSNSLSLDATNHGWVLIADDTTFMLLTDFRDNGVQSCPLYFGSFDSAKAGDTKNVVICGCRDTSRAFDGNCPMQLLATNLTAFVGVTGQYVSATPDNTSKSLAYASIGNASVVSTTTMGNSGMAYPQPVADGVAVGNVAIQTGIQELRGEHKFILNPFHDRPLNDQDTYIGTGDLSGFLVAAINVYDSGQMHVKCLTL